MKRKTRKKLPKLRKVSYKNKKHHYRLKDPFKKRKLAIHEGVNKEAKKTGKTIKKAAIAKKGRFNILRIYRKNKKVKECNIITHDMRYMDRKYGLGTTKNICGKKGGKRKTRKKRGGWQRDLNLDSEGKPYYKCPDKKPPKEWTYNEGIEISTESASQGRPIAQVFKIIKMNDRNGFDDPMLDLLETTRPTSNRRVDIAADTMCSRGFKPLKKNEPMEGAGRKKKTRKKRGGAKRIKKGDDGFLEREMEDVRKINEGVVILTRAVETLRAHEALDVENMIRNWPEEKFAEHQNELYQSLSAARTFIRETPPYIINRMVVERRVPVNNIRDTVLPKLQREILGLDFALLMIQEDDDAHHQRMQHGGRKRKRRKKRGGEYSRLAKKLLKNKTRRKIKKTEPQVRKIQQAYKDYRERKMENERFTDDDWNRLKKDYSKMTYEEMMDDDY